MSTLQNLKDSFYLTLRDCLAALDPGRTVFLRGATRPAIAVAENEIAFSDSAVLNCYLLHWDNIAVDRTEAMPLIEARCTIHYSTEGLPELAGMDRGRTLSAMDAELAPILLPPAMAQPATAPQRNYDGASDGAANSAAAVPLLSNVFWGDPVFAAAATTANRLGRSVAVQVFAWKEAA